MTDFACELVGGPFDGDCGTLRAPGDDPCPTLWAVACGEPGCDIGGVHWLTDEAEAARRGGERYVHTAQREGVQLYKWGGLSLPESGRTTALTTADVAATAKRFGLGARRAAVGV